MEFVGEQVPAKSENLSLPVLRKRVLLVLGLFACAAIVLVGYDDRKSQDTDLDDIANGFLFDSAIGSRTVLGQSTALETALRRLKKSKGKKYCNHACQIRKARIRAAIANKMKLLREQINDDFSSMIDFGHKAGYLPPPKSIKEQVMSGTLLKGDGKTGADAVAPPPFKIDPQLNNLNDVTPAAASSSHGSDGNNARLSGAHEKSSSKLAASHRQSSIRASAHSQPAPQHHAAHRSSSSDASDESNGGSSSGGSSSADSSQSGQSNVGTRLSSSDSSEDDSSSSSGGGGGGSGSDASSSATSSGSNNAWAKAFSFIKHTNNPIDGGTTAASSHSSGSSGRSFVGVTTFTKVAKTDRFLAGFEDPPASAAAAANVKLSSSSSSTSSSSGKGKGKDLLKSAESDKFLAGFLGGV